MTAFQITAGSRTTRIDNATVLTVVAATEAQALAFAQGWRDTDPKMAWTGATVIDIEADTPAATSLDGLGISVTVNDGVTPFTVFSRSQGPSVLSGAVVAGGADYTVDDVVTLVGGTFTRAATFTVSAVTSGAVTGLTLLDPGVYRELPTGTLATTTADGGTGLTIGTVTSQQHTLANVAASLVGLLNARGDIDGARFNATTRVLTVSSIADGKGDDAVTVEYLLNGVALPTYTEAIVDEGSAAAVLTVEFVASPVYPQLVRAANG